MKNNFNLTGEIKRSYKTKASGAYVSTAAALMMIVYAVASSCCFVNRFLRDFKKFSK